VRVGTRLVHAHSRTPRLARYLWHSPHGLDRLVDATCTHELDTAQALELAHRGALHAALERIKAGQRHRSPEART
jgi:glutamine synthetase adenylyltransferase